MHDFPTCGEQMLHRTHVKPTPHPLALSSQVSPKQAALWCIISAMSTVTSVSMDVYTPRNGNSAHNPKRTTVLVGGGAESTTFTLNLIRMCPYEPTASQRALRVASTAHGCLRCVSVVEMQPTSTPKSQSRHSFPRKPDQRETIER